MSFLAQYRWKNPRAAVVAMALIILVTLCALGTWQVQRLQWKTALIAEMSQKMAAEPMKLPIGATLQDGLVYRHVLAQGYPLTGKYFLLQPRVENGKVGAHLIVPLKARRSDRVMFVNMGWVPVDVDVTAVNFSFFNNVFSAVTTAPKASRFTPQNKPEKNEWYWADLSAMAKSLGAQDYVPYLLNLPAVGVAPDLPNNHKSYAIFWFAMAGVFIIIFSLAHIERKKP